ncbi:hypothetical protein LYSBPC_32690 [Lysinibacillus piscis]|uniref:SLH domain-containing protein n=1 Tax=Lysinibacillus piscis TaxID=2518931 RepID=A0ABQ5NPU4_9BACI|nr:hypothetical protein LYSBPC_32690 [Lysinibacillus sp. KH24]
MKNSAKFYDKLFKTAMATAMATSAIAVVAPNVTKADTEEEIFHDVKTVSDYFPYVNELFERGFVSGYPDGSFKPTGLLTRAQASKILALNLGLDVTKSFDYIFLDVPQNDWAYPYVAALKEAGIIDGYPDGSFNPNAPITRNQMAKIIVKGYGLTPATDITLPFTDITKNDWAAPYIQTLFDMGITIGQTTTTYGGEATVTRANMAAFTIRSEVKTDYQDNQRPDANVISAIQDNKITIDGKEYYIKKELQPLLHERNLSVLNEANLDFIKIGTKIVGIRNVELLHGGTVDNPLTLDLAGGTVDTNITIVGDYIKLANAEITGDITVKKGDQKQVEFNDLDLNGRLIIEGDAKRQQESVVKLSGTKVEEVVVNRDQTKIITDNATPTINVGSNVSAIEVVGKINAIDFIGNQDVFVKGTLESQELTIETPIKVTLENKAQLPSVETQQYGSQLIVPTDSTIGKLIKPDNIKPEEAVKLPTGGLPSISQITNISEVVRPTTPPVTPPVIPPSTGDSGNSGNSGGGSTTPSFPSQTVTVNNAVDAPNQDPLAVGMVGTIVTTSNANVATATITNGKINITSKGPGTAIITVKEDAPSLKEAQILVTVDASGKITHTIKRPLEVVQNKLTATPTPSEIEQVAIYQALAIQGITSENVAGVTKAVKDAIAAKGGQLTETELKLTVDTAILPYLIKKDNKSLEEVLTPLDLVTTGPNGTSFTWQSVEVVGSHNATIDLSTGNVTRDNANDENDTVKLHVKATNGSETKTTAIDTTIAEVKKPELVSATLQDIDNTGEVSPGDKIVLKFSELVTNQEGGTISELAARWFGQDKANLFGDNDGIWSTDADGKSVLTITVGANPTLTVGTSLTLLADKVADKYETKNAPSTVTVALAPYDYQIVTQNVAGAFYYKNNIITSEAAEKVPTAITFSRNGAPITDATVTYSAADVATGTIESGIFTLKSVQVTRNAKTETVTFTNGETISVNTAPVLNIVSATEFTSGVNSPHVQDGRVKTVKVATANIITVTSTQTLNYPVIIDGQDKLELTSGLVVNAIKDEVQLNYLKISGSASSMATNNRCSLIVYGATKLMLDHVNMEILGGGGYGFAGIILKPLNAQLVIKDSTVDAQYTQGGDNAQVGYGIRADGKNAAITIISSQITSKSIGDVGAYGIKGVEGTTVTITDGSVGVEASDPYSRTVYGIHLGSDSNLTVDGISTLKVVAPKANGFGIGNNDKYASLNVTESGTTFNIDAAAAGKRKAPYEYDVDTLNKINAALAKIDETLIKKANLSLQEVTTELNLPTTIDDLGVTWSATTVDSATIAQDGTVTRSTNDDTNDVVVVTATITENGITRTKDFNVTLIEQKLPTVTLAELKDIDQDGTPDNLELTFSESIASLDQVKIDGQIVTGGTWSPDRKILTITVTGVTLAASNAEVTILKDDHKNENVQQTIALTKN